MTEAIEQSIKNFVEIQDEYNGKSKTHIIQHFGNLKPIEEIDATQFDFNHFKTNYLKNNKPLVIRNALKVFNVGTAFKNWSLQYLADKCGSNKVHVRRNTIADEYKLGKAYFAQETTFQSYVDDLVEDNKRCQNSYLAVQNLKKAFPQIVDELHLPGLIFDQKLHAGPFLW